MYCTASPSGQTILKREIHTSGEAVQTEVKSDPKSYNFIMIFRKAKKLLYLEIGKITIYSTFVSSFKYFFAVVHLSNQIGVDGVSI